MKTSRCVQFRDIPERQDGEIDGANLNSGTCVERGQGHPRATRGQSGGVQGHPRVAK